MAATMEDSMVENSVVDWVDVRVYSMAASSAGQRDEKWAVSKAAWRAVMWADCSVVEKVESKAAKMAEN